MGRPPKFEERSAEIMQAFELCVARKGLKQTTLADVAAQAGLPRSLVRYFMGNRDEMVDRLIERLLSRAEESLSRIRDEAGNAGLDRLLDAYCGEVFGNDLSNTVVGELWKLSEEDEHVRERLNGVYDYAIRLVADAMRREGVGASDADRWSAGFSVVSLVLGETVLRDFGLEPARSNAIREAAGRIVDGMKRNSEKMT